MQLDPATLRANWNYPTSIRFGVGRIAELAEACRSLGMSKPLLVTDTRLAELPIVQNAVAANEAAGLPTGIFSDVKPNPIGKNVEDGVRVYREGGHDGVIAFGGGSALDVGKAVAFMSGQSRPIWDFEDIGDNYTRANVEGIAPIVSVPTTAGTGSEVGRASVIIDEKTSAKKIIFHPRMLPGVAICDPELTVDLPVWATIITGFDALAHNLEAYCSPTFHPLADGIALEGIRLVKEWLKPAAIDGKNLLARSYMMAAATMGATAFQKGLGAIHSLSHPLGALGDLHHGLLNAILMPYVLMFNRPAIEEKMVRLASYIGLPNASFDSVLDWIVQFRRELQIPHTLGEIQMTGEQIGWIVEMAEKDPSTPTNPIPIGKPELQQIFTAAICGSMP